MEMFQIPHYQRSTLNTIPPTKYNSLSVLIVHSSPTKQTIVQIPSFAEHKEGIQQLRGPNFTQF